jgi:SHS2 domain-containing protein
MKTGYELVDHTADIALRAWGLTREEVFEQAARAMLSLVCDPREIAELESVDVVVEAAGADLLLAAWLNELLYLFEARKLLFADFAIVELGDERLHARVTGERLDEERHVLCGGVKAATLHELSLVERDGRWEGFVVLDV